MGRMNRPVVIGVDPHKRVNAVVVVDAAGGVVGRGMFATNSAGMVELKAFAHRFPKRTWAVEGCGGGGKYLSQRLIAGGERVLDVATRRSALVRVYAGGNGRKNDDTDALAIALVGLRTPGLPEVRSDDRAVTLRLLVPSSRRVGVGAYPGGVPVATGPADLIARWDQTRAYRH
jgi:transposase